MPLITPPALQYAASTGIPLRFAKAYFTETGTTTPVAVYEDNECTTPHTDPVVADAQGIFPPIFYDVNLGLIRCRIISETGDLDNPLIDADPVNISVRNVVASITYVISGLGAVIPTGVHGDLEVPFDCTIQRVTLLADQVGSVAMDIWKDAYASFPPTDADSIVGTTPLAITASNKYQDVTLTEWETDIAAGETLRFNVDSCDTITRVTVSVVVEVT